MKQEMHTTFWVEDVKRRQHLEERHRWTGDIKMHLTETRCNDV